MKRRIKPGEQIKFSFTLVERDLILDHTGAGFALTGRLSEARVHDDRVAADYTLDELERLLASIREEAKDTEDAALKEALARLHDRLDRIEFLYEEVEDEEEESGGRRT